MASLHHSIPLFTVVVLVFLTSFLSPALSQDSGDAPLAAPTAAECGMRLLQLAPAVEGSIVLSEAQPWCKSVEQLQEEQPQCLCILLNDAAFNSFLLKSAVALKLPLLCDFKFDISACSGVSSGVSGLHSSDQDSSEAKASYDITEFSAYPPKLSTYPPEVSAYPPELSTYPPEVSAYPPELSTYPPEISTYPPELSACPPELSACPPELSIPELSTNYPELSTYPLELSTPELSACPPELSACPPELSTPELSAYPPELSTYPPELSAYPPELSTPELSACPPELSACPPAYPPIPVAQAPGMIRGSERQLSNGGQLKIEGHVVVAVVVSITAFLLKKATD